MVYSIQYDLQVLITRFNVSCTSGVPLLLLLCVPVLGNNTFNNKAGDKHARAASLLPLFLCTTRACFHPLLDVKEGFPMYLRSLETITMSLR